MPTSTHLSAPPAGGALPAVQDPRIDPTLPLHAQAELEKMYRDFDELENKRIKLY